MTVLHINPDSASLEFHMEVAGPKFAPIGEFINMLAIDVYGHPDAALREGCGRRQPCWAVGVRVHEFHAGFARSEVQESGVRIPVSVSLPT